MGYIATPSNISQQVASSKAYCPVRRFDPNDKLFCVYDKTQTEYEDKVVDVNGQPVVVEGVPKAGQSDLYYLMYELKVDLAVAVEDVNILSLNPTPDTNAVITAKIRNIGESAVSDVDVVFYEGDPQNGGSLIGSVQTIAGPIAGGEDANISVNWTVPEVNAPVEIYVVVDPCMIQEDRNWTNNTATVQVLVPDITITKIAVQRAGRNQIVTARVANDGVLTAENFEVTIRQDDPNGPLLDGYHIFEIVPGAYHDVSVTLSTLPVCVVTVYAVLDENNLIDEFGEENNTRSVRIVNYAPGDFEPDGDVDMVDLATLAGEWLETENLSADISPIGGDGIVNFSDFAEFAKYWLHVIEQ